MKQITKLTKDAKQKYTLIGEKGEKIQFALNYLSTQNLWSFNIGYNGWTLNGAILTASPNILRGYKNNIPFGISIVSNDDLDPLYLDDFTSGRIRMYLLNAAEVKTVEERLYA